MSGPSNIPSASLHNFKAYLKFLFNNNIDIEITNHSIFNKYIIYKFNSYVIVNIKDYNF